MLRAVTCGSLALVAACGSYSEQGAPSPPDIQVSGADRVAVGGTGRVAVRDRWANDALRDFTARGDGLEVLEAGAGSVHFRATRLGTASVFFTKFYTDFERFDVQVVRPTGVRVRATRSTYMPALEPYAPSAACVAGTSVSLTMELVAGAFSVQDDSASLAPLGAHTAVAGSHEPQASSAKATFTLTCGAGDGRVGFLSGGQAYARDFPGVAAADAVWLAFGGPPRDPHKDGLAFCFEAHAGGKLLLTDTWAFSSPVKTADPPQPTDPPNCVWLSTSQPGAFPVTVTVGGYTETISVMLP